MRERVCVPENPNDFKRVRVQIQIGELDGERVDSRNKIRQGS